MILVGINGYASAGKDTAAEGLPGYTRIAFADALRQVAAAVNPIISVQPVPYGKPKTYRYTELLDTIGYRAAKDRHPEMRRFLQALGVAVRDFVDEDAWVNAAIPAYEPEGRYVFTDMRFPNEAKALVENGGFTVRVERPGLAAVNDHISEHALDGWDFDYRVVNDGTIADLHRKIRAVHEDIVRRAVA